MEHPDLFYNLPCSFNWQLDTNMATDPWREVFDSYHNCTLRPKIYHGNGGAEIPETEDLEAFEATFDEEEREMPAE